MEATSREGSLAIPKVLWEEAYRKLAWFGEVYRAHTVALDAVNIVASAATEALSYRVDSSIGILWKYYRSQWLSCIPESKVLFVLRMVHDEAGYWAKVGIMAKLRGHIYWPH